MKKSLIALSVAATLAALSGAAQAQVTISGNLDMGLKSVTNSKNAQAASDTLAGNNTATSQLLFKGKEDLGNGLTASFLLEMDPTLNQSYLNNTSTPYYTGSPFNAEQYLSFAGDFGDIKLGTPNSPAMGASGVAQPFGTALGSGWSSGFGRLGTAGFSGLNQYVGGPLGGARIVRSEKAAVYTTPRFYDFSAQVEYSIGNQASGTLTSNDNRLLGLGINYNKGPLNVAFYNGTASAGGIAAAGTTSTTTGVAPANALAANQSVTWNILAANYKYGDWTGYAGYTTTLDDNTTGTRLEDSRSWNLGAKYQFNANTAVMANYLERTSNLASQDDATHSPTARLFGLGVNYNLSKNTYLYGRYEQISGLNVSAVASANGAAAVVADRDATQSTYAIGMKMGF
jgi:general bacterial porin, GBP family